MLSSRVALGVRNLASLLEPSIAILSHVNNPSAPLQRSTHSDASPEISPHPPDLEGLTQLLVNTPFEPSLNPIFNLGYLALESMHAWTGLPWWLAIPLTTLTVRTCLLPISLRQAKIIRTNYLIYKETVDLMKQQEGKSDVEPGVMAMVNKVKDSQQFLTAFHKIRTEMQVPHPIWILINPMIQVPIFIYCTATIRNMSLLHWPGFSSGGTLWFPDLTLAALIMSPDLPLLHPSSMPMGEAGFILPAAIMAMTLTSIRLGFRASGAAPTTTLGTTMMTVLPPLLYCLTLLNSYMTVQLPQGALLHWTTSSTFTLSLQIAMQRPAVRRFLGLPAPGGPASNPADHTSSPAMVAASSSSEGALAATSTAAEPPKTPGPPPLRPADPVVLARASAATNPDALVIMGAQHSARQHYANAIVCLSRAIEIEPKHARAHYALGQVFALLKRWEEAEAAYRACAESSKQPAYRGQALYCAGSMLQLQGKLHEAAEAYVEASELWQDVVVLWYSLARTYSLMGDVPKALEAVEKALQLEGYSSGTGSDSASGTVIGAGAENAATSSTGAGAGTGGSGQSGASGQSRGSRGSAPGASAMLPVILELREQLRAQL